ARRAARVHTAVSPPPPRHGRCRGTPPHGAPRIPSLGARVGTSHEWPIRSLGRRPPHHRARAPRPPAAPAPPAAPTAAGPALSPPRSRRTELREVAHDAQRAGEPALRHLEPHEDLGLGGMLPAQAAL